MDINSFDQWIDTLGDALESAKEIGMPEKLVERGATQLGEYLANHVSPDVPENRFLKELWEISDEKEKQALANMMIKYVEHYHNKH